MARSTDGRRRSRAGSLTVAELMRRQPRPTRVRPPLDTSRQRVPAHAEPPVEQEPDAAVLFRTMPIRVVAVFSGLLVLSTSILATGVIIGAPRADPPGAPSPVPIAIDGAVALRPDALTAFLSGSAASQPLNGTEPADADRPDSVGTRSATTDDEGAGLTSMNPTVVDPAFTGPVDDVELVETFLALLNEDPEAAVRLLAPEVHGGEDAFAEAWQDVHHVEVVEVAQRPEGTVVATVAVDEANGGRLYLTQQFVVGDTPERIIEVELLAAQQSETRRS